MTPRAVPIGDYGLIGDTRTAALVAPSGAIDWMCLPRFDGPPIFARLLGGTEAGHFTLAPTAGHPPSERRYRESTTTLETTWSLPEGEVTVADSMVGEITGRLLPGTLLVRRVTARGAPIPVTVHLAPRFGYERALPTRIRRPAGALVIEHRDVAVAITTDAAVSMSVDTDVSFVVDPSRPVTVAVSAAHRGPAVLVPPHIAAAEAERDEAGWRRWADSIECNSARRADVVRSLLTMQLLTYSPSGAPVAAPTTSLPEKIGGSRNWDYRYAWPRDASIGIAAFLAFGKHREADSFLAWLRHASRTSRPRLPALLTLDGRPGPSEAQIEHWPGYADSRPVRVGNGASAQHQLDGYGWVLDATWLLADVRGGLDPETWRMARAFADHVAGTWSQPDSGIWERRDAPRHHVHSKLMAWLGLDRAARVAEQRGGRAARRAAAWRAARDHVGTDVQCHGFDVERGAYTAAYGSRDLDAAVLILPLVGVEPPGSPRVTSTIEAIPRELSAGGPLLYRYLDDDGLPGGEGAFLPCSFWLVQALARIGRADEAAVLLDELVELGGPLGLYPEEIDPTTRRHLGNYPQALTHAAMLQAALAVDDATESHHA